MVSYQLIQQKLDHGWRDRCSVLNDFKSMLLCKVGDGSTFRLWYDKWEDDNLENKFPQLFSNAKNKDIPFAATHDIATEGLYEMFHLPMSTIAVQQSISLRNMISIASNNNRDNWHFYWSSTRYSTKSIYLELIGNPPDTP